MVRGEHQLRWALLQTLRGVVAELGSHSPELEVKECLRLRPVAAHRPLVEAEDLAGLGLGEAAEEA